MIHDILGFVLANHWAISEDGKRAIRAQIVQAQKGSIDASVLEKIANDIKLRNQVNYVSSQIGVVESYDYTWSSKLDDLTGDVIGIARYEGVMTRAGSWWSKGTEELRTELKMLGQNARVKAVILRLNTVGGTVDGTEELAIDIQDFEEKYQKPLVVFIDGCACSAGMWVATQSKRVFASSSTVVSGSIGTIGSFYDDREFLKEMGITEVTVRATKSPNKNTMYDSAADGDDTEWRAMLDSFNEVFHSFVKKGRGKKLKMTPSVKIGDIEVAEVLTGKIYIGQGGVEIGLIDQIDTLDNLVAMLQKEISNAATPNGIATNQNTIMFKKGLGAFVKALFADGKTPTEQEVETAIAQNAELEGVTAEQIDKLVADKVEAQVTAKTAESVSALTTKVDALVKQANDATEAAKKATDKAEAAETEAKAAKTENADLRKSLADVIAGQKGGNVGGDGSKDTEKELGGSKPLTTFNGLMSNRTYVENKEQK